MVKTYDIDLDKGPFALCLKQEIEFLNTGNMNLLIDPLKIYESDVAGAWNDAMAYLMDNVVAGTHPKHSTVINKTNRELIKCGFVATGRPKKIWALNVDNACIEPDVDN